MYTDWTDIEHEVSKFNRKHYKKVLETALYQDDIHDQLLDDKIRDKVLGGKLGREDVDDEDLLEFLSMLKTKDYYKRPQFTNFELPEWKAVVKRSNARSTSSIFSNRTYAVYKITLGSGKVTELLL